MELNPWSVDSIESFSFYCCPECIFRSKEENFFQIHALQNHVQSKEFFQEGNDESDVTIKEEVLEEVEEFSSVKLEIFNDMKHLSDSQNEGKKLYSYPVCNDSFDTKMAVKNHLSFTHEISSDRLSSYGCISHETQTPTYLNFTGEPKTRSVENGLEHEDPVKELHNNDINVAMGILDKKESDFQDENENFDCRSENESYESLENDGNFSSSSLTDEKEKVILSYSKREEVLTKIGTERDILFGKVQDGISKKQKDKCRNNFLKWCQKRGISYKTWGKVYENYSNWKRDWKRNQLERKKQNGLVAQPQEKWEQLLEICESKDLKMDQEKKNQLKQLKLNRSSLTEDKVRDEKVIISCSQREEVLTKIVTEKAFLFGKIKDGISWQLKDKFRDDFLKWCQLRGIPYKKWGRVYEHYFNWKRDWKRIQFEREKQAGSGAQPQEKWEQLLGLCESKDLEMDPEKKNQFKKMKLNKSSLTEDKVKIEKVILSQKKFKPETVENDSKEGVIDNGKDEVQCKNCGKQLKDQKTYRSHQRYYQGKCKPSESLDRPRYGYDPGRVSQRMSSEESIKRFSLAHMSHNSANSDFLAFVYI